MNAGKPPIAVLLVASVYIAVGAAGFVSHFHYHELASLQYDTLLIELTELLAVISGAFMLLARNWARWLALAWMAFHVALSFPDARELIMHSIIFTLIAWGLFLPNVRRYFAPLRSSPE